MNPLLCGVIRHCETHQSKQLVPRFYIAFTASWCNFASAEVILGPQYRNYGIRIQIVIEGRHFRFAAALETVS